MLTSFTNGKKNNKINSWEKQWEQYPSECEQSDIPTERENRKRSEEGGENTSNRVCPIFLPECVLEDKGSSSLSHCDRTTSQKTQHRNSQQEFFPRGAMLITRNQTKLI